MEWLNPAFGSFDDFGSAMLILYVASTGDGWEEFMWAGMDAVGVDKAPVRNDTSPASIFFSIESQYEKTISEIKINFWLSLS